MIYWYVNGSLLKNAWVEHDSEGKLFEVIALQDILYRGVHRKIVIKSPISSAYSKVALIERSVDAIQLVSGSALTVHIDLTAGEILDKPGTFLDFTKPETLDDQLAEIYGLTDEERELMRKDLKPWKDKVDVEADR